MTIEHSVVSRVDVKVNILILEFFISVFCILLPTIAPKHILKDNVDMKLPMFVTFFPLLL